MPKSIEFTANGSSSVLGNFEAGNIARNIPDALADHLVKDAMCAKYIDTQAGPVTKADAVERPRRARKAAQTDISQADASTDLAGEPRPE